MTRPPEKTVRVRVEGRVQGVAYRVWTRQEAEARGLDGWVRNRMDGTVEALFSGSPARVDDMVAACRRGPPAAHVTGLQATPDDHPAEPGFRLLPTR